MKANVAMVVFAEKAAPNSGIGMINT